MTVPLRSARRLAVPLSTGVVVATLGAVAAGTMAPAQAADTTLSKSFTYQCLTTVGDLNLRWQAIGVRASVLVPESVAPGDVLPPRTVNIDLTLNEALRSASYDTLFGRFARGAATNVPFRMTSDGATEVNVTIPSLSAPDGPIPAEPNAPWVIAAAGTVPQITAPADVAGTVTLHMPAQFTINAVVTAPAGGGFPEEQSAAVLDCRGQVSDTDTTPIDLVLGTVPVTTPATTTPPTTPTSTTTTPPTTPTTPTSSSTVPSPPPTTKPVPRNLPPRVWAVSVKTKKNKAKAFVVRASDPNRDRLTYRVTTRTAKGTVTGSGPRFTFKPKKKWKGKTSVVITVSDGRGGIARVRVPIVVR